MHTVNPQTALEALTRGRFLVSSWPWRSVGYHLTTLPPAAVAFVGLGIPWLILLTQLTSGDFPIGRIVGLTLLGAALAGVAGPLLAPPLAKLERVRLRLVDTRPVGTSPRHPASTGPVSWLRTRYTAAATWRQVGYACLLATVAPVLTIAVLLTVPLAAAMMVSPFLLTAQQPGGEPIAVGFGQVATMEQSVPYVVAGVLLLVLSPYLLALLAGGQAAVARALLVGAPTDRLRAELVEVSRSRGRLADAFDAERWRIQRDLHDGAQPQLVSLTLQLGLAQLDLPPGSPAAASVAAAHAQAKQLMAQLRELIHGIQPQILTDLGLPAALGELVDQSPVSVVVDVDLDGRLPSQVEHTVYFVVAEALTNIARHSGATGGNVTVRQHHGVLSVEISDNGRGGADPHRGTGLTGLADRVAATGGRMLLSSPIGGPTVLRVELPCPQNQPSPE